VSKVIPIALAENYAAAASTVCACLKVTRRDLQVFGFTEHNRALEVGGLTYIPGFSVSDLASSESLAVDNLELTILPDDQLPAEDLIAGLWNNAFFEIFRVNWKDVDGGIDVLKRGHTGEVQVRDGKYVVEFRSLSQALQQTQGAVTQKTCRARLGDEKCRQDLDAFTYSSTITSVSSRLIFTDTARGEAAKWFNEGIITFTSGANAGYSQKVKKFTAGGQFTLSLPMPFNVSVGDAYTVVAGCLKRLEDCRDKFDNVLNFQGEPHLPGMDAITKRGGAQ
jgi:uncharacterized phage protein (TIGR02218 family)